MWLEHFAGPEFIAGTTEMVRQLKTNIILAKPLHYLVQVQKWLGFWLKKICIIPAKQKGG